ncbi:myb-like protein AA [Monomorium pharaonis]|uniref:myb-like protein AA n=1 Tax=Monomorium pharaonis TaxID=307658 RepID=UPI00063FA12B|nr:myb-like protein AA [Monomorium pharaonis]
MRDRFSARRHVAEKYYDCLQCAEQCRHADSNSNAAANGRSNGYNNNNNGKNNSDGLRIRDDHLGDELYLDEEAASSPMQLRRIRSPRSSTSSKSLMRHHQSGHLTPVKKRSSLARPVRVHDSFVQPRRPMAEEDSPYPQDQQQQQQQQQTSSSCKNPWWWERRDHQEPNTSSYTYHRDTEDGSAGWPIRLRLEQMLELTLPQTKRKKKKKKKKKTTATATATMMLMKQQQRGKHGFKDTERLLKVLSINNVDQDNRYNVKRCSVM